DSKLEEGAAAGAAAGGALGGLIGIALAAGAIPGIGPVLAGGGLAGFLGAFTGVASGGLVGAVVGLDIPKGEAHHYGGAFRSGRPLVTVRSDGRYEEAVLILMRAAEGHGAEHRMATMA